MSDLDDLEELLGGALTQPGRRKHKWKVGRLPLTHCTRGHELTPENTKVYADGKRHCLKCTRLRDLCRED